MRVLQLVLIVILAGLFSPTTSASETRIVGGHPTAPGEWSATGAFVGRNDGAWDSQLCAGSLIARRWVLTVAHCLPYLEPSDTDILFNREDLRFPDGQRRAVVKTFTFPGFRPRSLSFDFGLVYLDRPVRGIAPFRIPRDGPKTGQALRIAGWGNQRWEGESSARLLEGSITAHSARRCRLAYGRLFRFGAMFCAGSPRGVDACQGDSGGPAVDSSGRVIFGLISQGRRCGNPDYPGIYSRVARARDWIQETLRSGPGPYRPQGPGRGVPYEPFPDSPGGDVWANPGTGRYQIAFYLYSREPLSRAEVSLPQDSGYCFQACGSPPVMERIQELPGNQIWALYGSIATRCLSLRWSASFIEPRLANRAGTFRRCAS